MGKDKSKKKKKKAESITTSTSDYDAEIEVLKAKREQLDGLIREAQIYLSQVKEMKKQLADKLGIEDEPIEEIISEPIDE